MTAAQDRDQLVIRHGDRALLRIVDAALDEARARSGPALACRAGCTPCCIGPFPISALDAWRLQQGLIELDRRDPPRAAGVRARADAAVTLMRSAFPGDAATGLLGDDDSTEERFCERFAHLPCPALDPASGRCDLYASRPLSCRTYGPPVRLEGEDLPPCELCFVGSKAADVDAARVSIDVADAEHSLIERVGAPDARGTLVAFALLR